jgi:hypothetical protein
MLCDDTNKLIFSYLNTKDKSSFAKCSKYLNEVYERMTSNRQFIIIHINNYRRYNVVIRTVGYTKYFSRVPDILKKYIKYIVKNINLEFQYNKKFGVDDFLNEDKDLIGFYRIGDYESSSKCGEKIGIYLSDNKILNNKI